MVIVAIEPVGAPATINMIIAALAIERVQALAAFEGVIVGASKELVVVVSALEVEDEDVAAFLYVVKTVIRVIVVVATIIVEGKERLRVVRICCLLYSCWAAAAGAARLVALIPSTDLK